MSALGCCFSFSMQSAPVPLWPDHTPGALGSSANDIPTLTAYLPAAGKANGASMLILPGGGYGMLADHEGKGYADWLVAQGVTCYVLKYRLGSHGYRHPAMLNDAARGLRLVRSFARRDGLDPARVGIIGSSAGGHLASTLLTHFDAGNATATDPIERESSRPDLGVLCYPVITMGQFTHQGSKTNLLGSSPSPELVQNLSNELQVTPQTPPCFLWHTVEDASVPVENSLLFAEALRRNHVPFSLHIYEKGRHGLGLTKGAPPWADQCLYWFGERGFLGAAKH
ncbi:MAG: alpha/beta hydrolase [Verrucomicrobia bacterium]|nr:alpha/beta hydrolase [Verrucomicrobiota bacterium]